MAEFTFSKREFFTAVANFAETGVLAYTKDEGTVTISVEDAKAFATHEIDLLDRRAAKAKETKAAKAAEPDEFEDAILEALTDEFKTAGDIVAAIGNEDLSVSKAVYRLNALVEDGRAVKEDIKIEGVKGTRKGFKRA